MRHRGLEPIHEQALTEAIARIPPDHYVIWTGVACGGRAGSLRSRALACVVEVAEPVPLRTVVRRAATIEASYGLDPDCVRSAVRLHQSARPAEYLLVRRTPSLDYAAVADIPFAAGGGRRIAAGEIVMSGHGRLLIA